MYRVYRIHTLDTGIFSFIYFEKETRILSMLSFCPGMKLKSQQ